MSGTYTVALKCNDCARPFEAGPFPTLELARDEAKNQGWEFIQVHRVELDFCPDCQIPSGATMAAAVTKRR